MGAGRPERLDRRFMAALCLAAVAGLVNNSALGPFIPEIARDFESSVPATGQAATASWLMAAFSGVFAGPLADHYGLRRILVGGLLLTAVSALGGAAAPGYWALVLARVAGGMGFSATVGITFAIATTRYSGNARLRALSVLSSSLSFAGILGIPVLTTIAGPFSWRGAWVFVTMLAAGAILLLVVTIPAMAAGGDGRFRLGRLGGIYAPLLRSRGMLLLFSGTVFQGVLFLSALTYNGAYYVDELGLSVQQFGLVATISGTSFFLGSLAAGRLGRFALRAVFAWTTLATGLLLMGAYVTTSVVVATALISAAFLFGGVQVVNLVTLVSNETPTGQATTLVINEALFGLGAAIGAATGGLLIALGGYTTLGFGMPIFAVLAAGAVWRPGAAVHSQPAIETEISAAIPVEEAR